LQAYNAPFAFFLIARIKIKVKIFGSTIWNMYLCAQFSSKKIKNNHAQQFHSCSIHMNIEQSSFLKHAQLEPADCLNWLQTGQKHQ
jgi:hypothetical protein